MRERESERCNESESFRFTKPVSGIQSWCVVYKKKKRGFSNVNALESREGSLKSERQEREEECI